MPETYINVVGDNAEQKAKAIAKYYSTTCKCIDIGWIVVCNKELERALCYSDEDFEKSINDINAACGTTIAAEDISF